MIVVNAPGHVTTSPRLVRQDARHWKRIPGLSAFFVTEVADNARADALVEKGDGWTLSHDDSGPGRGECAIVTNDKLRTVVETRWIKLTDGGGKGRLTRPTYAIVVITRAPSGRVTLLTGAHLPAHIEGIWAHIPLPARVKVKALFRAGKVNGGILQWIEAVQRWQAGVTRLAAEHHADDIIVAPDGNVDAHKPWVREMISRAWPGLRLTVTKDNDLGNRAVGWVLTTMEHVGGHVYQQESSDHHAGRYDLKHVNKPPAVKPVKAPDPFEHVVYNGALMDQKTKAAVQLGEKRLGYTLTILQGCYHPGVSQSAGTHDGGQVIDFAPFDFAHKIRVFREMGWFIWHRLPIPGVWGEHIHGGIRNGGTLSPSAKAQQGDYDGIPPRDGLAGHSLDMTFHPNPRVGFNYSAAWHEIND